MSCNDGSGCGNCSDCPEKAEAKKVMGLWKSIFKKVLVANDAEGLARCGEFVNAAFTEDELVLVRKQLKDFEES